MVHAPKISGQTWLNSSPVKPEDLQGKVVLVDFWTYTCVNCVRTLPYLRQWWEKYKDQDFILLGVHTPEFEFEKDEEKVAQALADLGVTWPVVLDNNYQIWRSFANRYWPAKYLVNRRGQIVYHHFGEGEYAQTEEAIKQVLASDDIDGMKSIEDLDAPKFVCTRPTPELYCGYDRGEIANVGGYRVDRPYPYEKPNLIPPDTIALEGEFLTTGESAEFFSPTATLWLKFIGTEVNLVFQTDTAAEFTVALNGQPVPPDFAGADLKENTLHVKESRMYRILKADTVMEGELSIQLLSGRASAYAFTFSGCV